MRVDSGQRVDGEKRADLRGFRVQPGWDRWERTYALPRKVSCRSSDFWDGRGAMSSKFKRLLWPWLGGSACLSIVLIFQGGGFDSPSRHVQERIKQ